MNTNKDFKDAMEWLKDLEYIGFFKLSPQESKSLTILRNNPHLHDVVSKWVEQKSYIPDTFEDILQSFTHGRVA